MTDILVELRQDIVKQKYNDIWKKYGAKLILAIVSIILILISYILYDRYQVKNAYQASAIYERYLDSVTQGNLEEAELLYSDLIEKDGGKIFWILANLKATIDMDLVQQDGLRNRSSNYKYYYELLQVKEYDYKEGDSSRESLEYLENEYNLQRAFVAIENGDLEKARESFALILVSDNSSQSYQTLAMEFINYLDEKKYN